VKHKAQGNDVCSAQEWRQVSMSTSKPNVLRGIHCSPYCKLITCVAGEVTDFVVDLRRDSPTFLQWAQAVLSRDNNRQMFIPAGCGHCFFSHTDSTILYLQGGCFSPSQEVDISPFDPDIALPLPAPADVCVVSAKDLAAPTARARFPDLPPGSTEN